ncbi:TPA: hypothetical protein PNR44_004439, partial [Salmonella enterica]|nr:hypothetical protein [Salmonella enterica]HDI5355698.1 hypothetical protein [Salmonella enterica]
NDCTDAVNVKSQPEHGAWLIKLDVFRHNGAFFPCDTYTKVQIIHPS